MSNVEYRMSNEVSYILYGHIMLYIHTYYIHSTYCYQDSRQSHKSIKYQFLDSLRDPLREYEKKMLRIF